jgi:hypothetical protein
LVHLWASDALPIALREKVDGNSAHFRTVLAITKPAIVARAPLSELTATLVRIGGEFS